MHTALAVLHQWQQLATFHVFDFIDQVNTGFLKEKATNCAHGHHDLPTNSIFISLLYP
jgi:hypothetical protein